MKVRVSMASHVIHCLEHCCPAGKRLTESGSLDFLTEDEAKAKFAAGGLPARRCKRCAWPTEIKKKG